MAGLKCGAKRKDGQTHWCGKCADCNRFYDNYDLWNIRWWTAKKEADKIWNQMPHRSDYTTQKPIQHELPFAARKK